MKFRSDAGNAMQQQFTPIRRFGRNTSAVLFHDSPRQRWEMHVHVPYIDVKASADSTQRWHWNLVKHRGCYPLQISRAVRNEDSTSRQELMAEIRMMPPQNCRMRIAETAAQVRKRRNWLFSEGVLQDLAHPFQSLPLHLCDLLGDFRAQLWKVFP